MLATLAVLTVLSFASARAVFSGFASRCVWVGCCFPAFCAFWFSPLVLTLVAVPESAVGDKASFVVDSLPGAAAPGTELVQRLKQTWASRRPGYEPRTKHLNEDGTPRYTNRLFLSSSPYLLQHAHNPVDWYPWGNEAFETARKLGRPVLLSVGYSTCHWCHVMEEESFEDEEIARFMNEHFVAIKVDREERPDVDAIYMNAVQSLTGRGGWPMTVWLTPDRKPFYGGTYFPARDGDRGSRVGFLTLLRKTKAAYQANPDRARGSRTRRSVSTGRAPSARRRFATRRSWRPGTAS